MGLDKSYYEVPDRGRGKIAPRINRIHSIEFMKGGIHMKWEIAKLQTFGVEIEMNSISRENAARIAAEFFGTNEHCYTHSTNGYYTYSAWDGRGREWKFSKDVSIAGPDDYKCEMVTPILRYDDDMESLQELIRKLRAAGAISNPEQGCGVHIHIGANADMPGGHDGRSLRNLVHLMKSHEQLLIKSVGIANSRLSGYCKPVNDEFMKALDKARPTTAAGVQEIWYESNHETHPDRACGNTHYYTSRYRMLNLHSMHRTHTIEFRLFQFDNPGNGKKNGLHAGAMKAYIQLCLAMSQQAKESRSISSNAVQLDNEKFAMRTWMNRMGMIGDEFKTAHEIFRRKLSGDAAFRYGRPE